jgi:hypothetical protein
LITALLQGIIPRQMVWQSAWCKTMGYRFSKHASLASFSPYYLLFGRHPVLPHTIQADADTVLANMDNPDTWALVSEQRAELFKRVMPMALENLSIPQHRDTLRYATI